MDDDLDTALTRLQQSLSDVLFMVNLMLELRRSADRLHQTLGEELRAIRAAIDEILPRL